MLKENISWGMYVSKGDRIGIVIGEVSSSQTAVKVAYADGLIELTDCKDLINVTVDSKNDRNFTSIYDISSVWFNLMNDFSSMMSFQLKGINSNLNDLNLKLDNTNIFLRKIQTKETRDIDKDEIK